MIFDKKEGGRRPVCFRDMALLFPTLTGIDAYEEALKSRGIPYRLEGGKEFYMRQEVRSLLCCLKALDDPADDISLVAALRSPFFGFSDEEIFLFASSGNRLSYLHPPEEEGSGFAEAFSLLRKLHGERNSRSHLQHGYRSPLPDQGPGVLSSPSGRGAGGRQPAEDPGAGPDV